MVRWNWFQSILSRLLLLGVVLVSVALIGRYFVFSRFLRDDITQVVAQQQLSLANYAAQDIDHKITQRQEFLQHLAASLPAQALRQPAELERWISSTQAVQTLFSAGLLVADESGRLLTHARIPSLANTPALLTDEALRALRGGAVYVGQPVPTTDPTGPALPIMVRIAGKSGEESGRPAALLIGLTFLYDPDFMGNLMKSRIGQSTGGFLLISPRDKLFVASTQPAMVLKPTPPVGVNLLHDQAMAGYRGTGVTVNAQGVEEISAMVTVPSTGWFVVARIPTAEALVTVDHAKAFMFRNAVFSMAVFLTIFVVAVYFLLRPLMRATAQAEKMTRGLVPLQPLHVHSGDEVGTLIGAFNRLLGKLNEQNSALAAAAYHDALTGLPNRTLLADHLRQAQARAARRQSAVALLFLDLDMFKPINDSLGHEAGDKVLQEVARRLTAIVRSTDSVARIGGDEFVVLLAEVTPPAQQATERVAQEIIAALRKPIEVAGTQCQIGVSIGCVIGDAHSSPAGLLLKADHLMYQAKAQGRGRYVIEYDEEPASPAP
jgi:diguanylate cyclase (GGDEF)-like protein